MTLLPCLLVFTMMSVPARGVSRSPEHSPVPSDSGYGLTRKPARVRQWNRGSTAAADNPCSGTRCPVRPTNGEFLVDTTTAFAPSLLQHNSARVASDGADYLVVWSESCGTSWDIHGTRVTRLGHVLDVPSITISSATGGQSWPSPSVAFDGANYFVVWLDGGSASGIYGARVSPAGHVLDTMGIRISPLASNHQSPPSIASNRAQSLVAWAEMDSLRAARVNRLGEVLDSAGIVVSTQPGKWISTPGVAFNGTDYLVVWAGTDTSWLAQIYAARVTQSGILLDSVSTAITDTYPSSNYPAAASEGSNCLVAWQGPAYPYGSAVNCARVDRSNRVIDTTPIVVSAPSINGLPPSVTFDGLNYFVVWCSESSGTRIRGARVSTGGELLDTASITISTGPDGQDACAVAAGDSGSLVVWHDVIWRDIYGTLVDQEGTVSDSSGSLISATISNQYHPSVAAGAAGYLAVWEERRNPAQTDIYGIRMQQSGTTIDSAAFPVSVAPDWQRVPSVASDGTDYMVIWQDGRDSFPRVFGARVSQSGTVWDTAGIAVSSSRHWQWNPRADFEGSGYLVVWHEERNGRDNNIYGARVDQNGVVLDSADLVISDAAEGQFYPSLAFDGTNSLVVWQDWRDTASFRIYATRVNPSGAILDTAGIAISAGQSGARYPAVAFDGTNYLAVWEDYDTGSPSIRGRRVARAGVVLDTANIVVSTSAGWQRHPAVGYDGTNYVVAWEDWSDTLHNIRCAKIATSGVVLERSVISGQAGMHSTPTMARGTGDQILVCYSCWTGVVQGKRYDAYRTWGNLGPEAAVEVGTLPAAPRRFLLTVSPNPFSHEASIVCADNSSVGRAYLQIRDIGGRLVRTLGADKTHRVGSVVMTWDGTDDLGQMLPSGIYVVTLAADASVRAKVVLNR